MGCEICEAMQMSTCAHQARCSGNKEWWLLGLAEPLLSNGRSGACWSDGPVSGAGVLPQESSPGMLKVKNASQKCFPKCSLKDHLAFIFKRHSLSVHLPDSTSHSLPFSLSSLYFLDTFIARLLSLFFIFTMK